MDAINKGLRGPPVRSWAGLIPTICSAPGRCRRWDTSFRICGGAMADHAHPAAAECRRRGDGGYRVPGFSAPGFNPRPAPGPAEPDFIGYIQQESTFSGGGGMERAGGQVDASQPWRATLSYGCAFLNTLIWRPWTSRWAASPARRPEDQWTSTTITRRPAGFCRPIGPKTIQHRRW